MKKITFLILTALIAFSMVTTGCNDATGNNTEGEGNTTDDGSILVGFNEDNFGDYGYNPGDALTVVDSETTAEYATDQVSEGAGSLKLSGSIQQDKYDTTDNVLNDPPQTVEFGYRLKLAELLDLSEIEAEGKILSVDVFVAAEANNTAIQFAFQDDEYEQSISQAVNVTPGEWNTVYFILLGKDDASNTMTDDNSIPSFASCDSTGSVTSQGAYTSANFDETTIVQFEIRSLGGTVGDNAVVYIDNIKLSPQS